MKKTNRGNSNSNNGNGNGDNNGEQNNNNGNGQKRFDGYCEKCGKYGHNKEHCWNNEENKDKRPEWYKPPYEKTEQAEQHLPFLIEAR